jgi:hypothetical protein
VYTLATLPDPLFTNLPTHPIFLPVMVRMSLRPPSQSLGQNIDMGTPLSLPAGRIQANEMQLESPSGAVYVVPRVGDEFRRPTVSDEVGLYRWYTPDRQLVAVTQGSPSGTESDLTYRDPAGLSADPASLLVATSVEELADQLAKLAEPEPRWSPAIACVIGLLCLEAWLGSVSQLWSPKGLWHRSATPAAATAVS